MTRSYRGHLVTDRPEVPLSVLTAPAGFTVAEIAEVLQMPTHQVQRTLKAALAKLRRLLEDEDQPTRTGETV